jgi:HEAT repeat protein
MATTKKPKVTFEENLQKITDLSQPVHISALYALSNMTPERQALFEAAWIKLPLERRRKIAGSLNDLTEDVVELDFTSVYTFFLKDEDAEIRSKGVEGLWEDESRPVLGELLKLLENDPAPMVREKAALGVGRFAFLAELGRLPQRWIDRVRETLLAQVDNPKNSPEIQRRLIEGLGYFNNDDQVTKVIEKAYRNEDELIKAGALRAMGRNMNPRWLPEIGKELSNADPVLRYEAATAVGEMGSKELLPSLIKLTDDKDREVRLAAIWALGQIGGPEASRTLKVLVKDENSAVREAAQEALREISYADNPLNPLGGELS